MIEAIVCLCSCGSGLSGPELLSLGEVAPSQIAEGDVMEITGNGFPASGAAQVTLRGTVHRPGLQPERSKVVLSGSARNATSLEVRVGRKAMALLTTEQGVHATFRGQLMVDFATREGQTPVFGLLEGVVLDFEPKEPPVDERAARFAAARAFREALGVELESSSDFLVKAVRADSPGAEAGLQAGDRLVALDGVRLLEETDFVASGAGPDARLEITRGALQTVQQLDVDVSTYQAFGSPKPRLMLHLLALFSMVLILGALPGARFFTWAVHRTVSTLSAVRRRQPTTTPMTSQRPQAANRMAVLRPMAYVVLLAVGWTFTLIGSEHYVIGPDWDLPLFTLWAVTVLAAARLIGGGAAQGRWGLFRGLRAAAASVMLQIPAALALLILLVHEGTLSASELVTRQGGAPWQWYAFSSPLLLGAAALWLLAMLPGQLPKGANMLSTGGQPMERWAWRVPFSEWVYLLTMAHLGATLFCGGWATSLASSPSNQGTAWFGEVLGLGLLELKSVAGVLCVLAIRFTFLRVAADELLGLWMKIVLPLSVCMVSATLGHAWLVHNYELRALPDPGVFLFVLLLTVLGIFAFHVARGLRRPPATLSLNPWL